MAPDEGKDTRGDPLRRPGRPLRPCMTLGRIVEGVEPGPLERGEGAGRKAVDEGSGVALSAKALGLASVTLLLVLIAHSATTVVEARSPDFAYGPYGSERDENWRITCYTCMNVSSNEECNRYAIDRPCPEGKDYCLTVHVMEWERSVLVNKRCASLDECTADSTGCSSDDGQTRQCVSCCDQPYCNDYVPSNETSAMFHRSSAIGTLAGGPLTAGRTWRVVGVVLVSVLCTTKCGHVLS